MNKLTPKEKKFSNNYLDNGGNGTKAVKDADYDVSSDNSAAVIANTKLRKVKIQEYLEEKADGASSRVVEMSKTAKNENVKLSANKDILDRAGFKPTEKFDHTSKGEKIESLTPELQKKLDKYEKEFNNDLKNDISRRVKEV